ncbi:hypothetical protein MHY87_08470 [Microvirga sp. ACRRW]|uniref:hypothetical protein n=1 Tax=Microvirga sp. ACRRW TaxID=2918205 RepID=UPI001EF43FB7|nr:hypothetical protein [Microvirga sp. ACRRW]MCG7392935.1 hypothetical protein [Microvirga sp. ACRRW]
MAHFRFMLRLLTVAMLAVGLASAPLYAAAQAASGPMVVQPHHGHKTQVGQASSDHDHMTAGKIHTLGQSCCHPGCVMAVVPGFASLATAPMPWTTLAIPRDRGTVPITPSGLDRPPKSI